MYKIRFADSVRFMSSSLSSLTDNLAEDLHEGKCMDLQVQVCLHDSKCSYTNIQAFGL